MPKKRYEKPAIVFSQILATRAVVCVRNTAQCQSAGGPLES
jgi:hypothetical protein